MTTSDSSPTLPRVDAHLPGPGDRWVPRTNHPDVPTGSVVVIERDRWEVHYDIYNDLGVRLLRWKTSLSQFMEHYRRAELDGGAP